MVGKEEIFPCFFYLLTFVQSRHTLLLSHYPNPGGTAKVDDSNSTDESVLV